MHSLKIEKQTIQLLSSFWVSRTGSASDWCALQEALYKCIDTIQYNTVATEVYEPEAVRRIVYLNFRGACHWRCALVFEIWRPSGGLLVTSF